MTEHIINTVVETAAFFNLQLDVYSVTLSERMKISASIKNGVYIIEANNKIVYVGKGTVRDRMKTHIEKISGEFHTAKDTTGFKILRETTNITVKDCKVYYMDCKSEINATAMEGALMKKLMPLANNETYKTELV